MAINKEIFKILESRGADIISFTDISNLPKDLTRGYNSAILIGKVLSAEFVRKVRLSASYTENLKSSGKIEEDEFHRSEQMTDALADEIAAIIEKMGFPAFSQSENNLESTGYYNKETQTTLLPHKTIARMAGLGWIGKHNLIVNPDFGSAVSMCTVLTNAPIITTESGITDNQCGVCSVCVEKCNLLAIKGKIWKEGISRNEMLDPSRCNTCLDCMVHCPWTQKYVRMNL